MRRAARAEGVGEKKMISFISTLFSVTSQRPVGLMLIWAPLGVAHTGLPTLSPSKCVRLVPMVICERSCGVFLKLFAFSIHLNVMLPYGFNVAAPPLGLSVVSPNVTPLPLPGRREIWMWGTVLEKLLWLLTCN